MPYSAVNRVRHLVATTGQGTVTLGSASAGFMTMAEASAVNGRSYVYMLEEGNDFEIGVGVYSSAGPTMTRATVFFSKISGTAGTRKMTLAGAATLTITYRYEDFVKLAAAKSLTAALIF